MHNEEVTLSPTTKLLVCVTYKLNDGRFVSYQNFAAIPEGAEAVTRVSISSREYDEEMKSKKKKLVLLSRNEVDIRSNN